MSTITPLAMLTKHLAAGQQSDPMLFAVIVALAFLLIWTLRILVKAIGEMVRLAAASVGTAFVAALVPAILLALLVLYVV